jgi:hydroxyacylglutathione hydrolase
LKRTIITDKITYVEPNSMSNFASCAGIIFNSGVKVLLDTNMGHEETPGLIKEEKPDIAIITHFHLDHSTFARYAEEYSEARVLIPAKEACFLSSLDFMIANTAGLVGMEQQWRDFVTDRLKFRPLNNPEVFDENTPLNHLIPDMVAIPTPGHSPGHFSFYFPEDKILFTGDLGLDRFGPWYGWKNCSINEIVQSLLKLDTMPIELILTSHGGIIIKEEDIHHIIADSLAHIKEREKKIVEKLDKGMSHAEIIEQGIFYPGTDKIGKAKRKSANSPNSMQFLLRMWDTIMFEHHIKLILEGGIEKVFSEIGVRS